MLSFDRRKFLKTGLAASAACVAGSSFLVSACREKEMKENKIDKQNFGIQLWSVKEDMTLDPKGTLEKLSAYGYSFIESFEGEQGMFWGMEPDDFKNYLADLNMRIASSHCNAFEGLEKKAADAAIAGIEYLICPWIGPGPGTLEYYRKKAEEFSRMAEVCQQEGVRFAYHNHDYSFLPIDGTIPQEILMTESAENVFFEIDVYWVVAAGQDPVAWIEKYPGRWPLLHIKDREGLPLEEKNASTLLGDGSLDFSFIFDAYKDQTSPLLIVEQERFENTTPMEAAEKNAVFMKGFLKDRD